MGSDGDDRSVKVWPELLMPQYSASDTTPYRLRVSASMPYCFQCANSSAGKVVSDIYRVKVLGALGVELVVLVRFGDL